MHHVDEIIAKLRKLDVYTETELEEIKFKIVSFAFAACIDSSVFKEVQDFSEKYIAAMQARGVPGF